MNIYRKLGNQLESVTDSLVSVYRDGRALELCNARLLDIMRELESCKPFENFDNSEK